MNSNNLTPKEKLKIAKKRQAYLQLQKIKDNMNPHEYFKRKKKIYKKDTMNNINYVLGPDLYNRQQAFHQAQNQFHNISTSKKVFIYILLIILFIFIVFGGLTVFGIY